MKASPKTSGISCLIVIVALVAAVSAYAQQNDQPATRQAHAVNQRVFDQLQDVQAATDAEQFEDALRQVAKLEAQRLTDYERSKVLQYKAFVFYAMGDSRRALNTYLEILRIPDLEPQMVKQIRYSIAQLCLVLEKFNDAIENLEIWFQLEPNPPPDAYILYAQALYQADRHAEMIEPIETAINISRERNTPAKENWYALLGFAYFQQENYPQVRDVHQHLLAHWPSKRYWLTLAGTYTELGEQDKVFAIYDALRTQNLLDTEAELVTMAQLYLRHDVPFKAGNLLDAEIRSGRIAPSAANYRLMSQAWTLAQETERAVPALQQAAQLSDDGELDIRLANAYLNLGRYEECVNSAQAALEKGGLRSPDNAQLSLGMCYYNVKNYKAATSAFAEAAKAPQLRRTAEQWIQVVDQEQRRIEMILVAEAAAREKLGQLEKRRATAGGQH